MQSNSLTNAVKNLTAVILGIAIIPHLWTALEQKNQNKSADLQRMADSIGSATRSHEAKRAAEKLAAQDAPQSIAVVAESKSLDRSEPSITEMLAVFDDAQLDAIAENATKYSDDVSPAELVSYFKPELKSIVHKLVFDSRERSPLSAEQKQYMVDTQVNRARDAVSRAVAKKHS